MLKRTNMPARLFCLLLSALLSRSALAAVEVEQWDTHEIALPFDWLRTGSGVSNPFAEVTLTCTFTHASGTVITVNGFHDGDGAGGQDGNVWKVRFMPTRPGKWTWRTSSNRPELRDKQSTDETRIECVAPKKPYLHGPLVADGFHFKHADGTRRFLVSTRLSCQFDNPKNWDDLVAYLKANRINRVFFMVAANAQDSKAKFTKCLFGRDFADMDASRFHIDAWRRIDNFINTLRVNDIIASPYFYYFNDQFQRTMTSEQDDRFITYGMARFGSFGNIMPVLGNQIEHKSQKKNYEGYNFDFTWQNEKGGLLKKLAVYGQVVTVHSPSEGRSVNPSFWTALHSNPYRFADCILRQAQVAAFGDAAKMDDATPEFDDDDGDGRPEISAGKDFNERAFARHNQYCIDMRNRHKIPIINEEPGYDMERDDGVAWNTQNHNTTRATFWTATVGGAYAAWGSKATYANGGDNRAYPDMPPNVAKPWGQVWGGEPLRAMKLTPTAAYLRILHDFMASLPYWEMTPDNSIVTGPTRQIEGENYRTTFCLKKDNAHYVVYALNGGAVTINLPRGLYRVKQINPREEGGVTDLGTKSGGSITVELPLTVSEDYRQHTGDWVLYFARVSDQSVTPPSGGKETPTAAALRPHPNEK